MRKLIVLISVIFLMTCWFVYKRIANLAFESKIMIMFIVIAIPSIFLGMVWSINDIKHK